MTRKRSEHSIHAEENRLKKASTQTILHRLSGRLTYRKSDFYRHARHVHAWLSAFAFLSLIFFSATGLLLNHPDWFASESKEVTLTTTLPTVVITQAKTLENPAALLLDSIRKQPLNQPLLGAFKSSDVVDGELDMRLEGVKGHSDIAVMLDTGHTEIKITPASTIDTLNNLHRGKNAGVLWQWVIDISAVLILILSLAGYILFFSLRKRKVMSLWLTAACLVTMFSIFIWGVP